MRESIKTDDVGRTIIEREICGNHVTVIFHEETDDQTIEKVKRMIMDAYAERKAKRDKAPNLSKI